MSDNDDTDGWSALLTVVFFALLAWSACTVAQSAQVAATAYKQYVESQLP